MRIPRDKLHEMAGRVKATAAADKARNPKGACIITVSPHAIRVEARCDTHAVSVEHLCVRGIDEPGPRELGPVAVPAALLHSALGAITGWVDLHIDGARLRLRHPGGSMALEIVDCPWVAPMTTEECEDVAAAVATPILRTAIESVAYARLKGDSRPQMAGVFLGILPGRVVAAATDGHRGALADMSDGAGGETSSVQVFIDPGALGAVTSIEAPIVSITRPVRGWVAISDVAGGETVYVRVPNAAFPIDSMRLLAERRYTHEPVTVSRDDLRTALRICDALADPKAAEVRIGYDFGALVLSTPAGEGGQVEEVRVAVHGQTAGETVARRETVRGALEQIIEAVGACCSDRVSVSWASATDAIVIMDGEGVMEGKARHFTMPMKPQ